MFNLPSIDAFGFHAAHHFHHMNLDDQDGKNLVMAWNITNIIAYVPIIGTIVGIAKNILLSFRAKRICSPEFLLASRVRAIVETLSLGFLFLLPDLIITVGRTRAYNSQQAKKQQADKMLADGLDKDRPLKERLELMEEAVQKGAKIDFFEHRNAILEAVEIYRKGSDDDEVEQDIDKAIFWLKLIEKDDVNALRLLADLYITGEATCEDPEELYELANRFEDYSRRWFELTKLTAESEHAKAMSDLGRAYFNGCYNVLEKNIDEAIRLFNEAADKQDSSACIELAGIYLSGLNGTKIDVNKGAEYLLLAFNYGATNIALRIVGGFLSILDKKSALAYLTQRGDVDPSILSI